MSTPTEMGIRSIALVDLIALLRANRRLVAGITVLFTLLAILFALLAKPVYEAEVLVMPVTEEHGGAPATLLGLSQQIGPLGQFSSLAIASGARDEAIATLQSRDLFDQLIRQDDLLPILFEDYWDAEKHTWKRQDPKHVPTIWDGVRLFREDICKVNESRKNALVTVTIRWRDPVTAAEWANKIVSLTNEKLRRQAVDRTENNLRYLREELKTTATVEVQQAIFALLEKELNQAMLAKGSTEYALRVVDKAVVPKERIWPKRRLIVMLGMATGFATAVIWLIVAPFFRLHPRVES